ncbi:glutamate cyclase domain-containing protein [Dasania marina]|uniref:glutamate cyclase domain-containing protein n=1 Tax=Dasania marina TaxID=471499 RepID=UPI000360C796|nr:glutamate cyclase domain-containing protein [Dasania marina]
MTSTELRFNSTEQALSQQIENILVARNPRGMQNAQAVLEAGYYYRAARVLQEQLAKPGSVVLIGTGFPVPQPGDTHTFETDGPVGAIALYDTFKALGMQPIIITSGALAAALAPDYRVHTISEGNLAVAEQEAKAGLAALKPDVVVSIEMPGLNANGQYSNMRGEDISHRCPSFDDFLRLAACPTMAIGDGGNEIGMGNIAEALESLSIIPARTQCDELMVADVSNWGAYGLIVWLSLWNQQDLLAPIKPRAILEYLSVRGSVDGVSRENTVTEDGMEPTEGESVIAELRAVAGF